MEEIPAFNTFVLDTLLTLVRFFIQNQFPLPDCSTRVSLQLIYLEFLKINVANNIEDKAGKQILTDLLTVKNVTQDDLDKSPELGTIYRCTS
jgi:hypothetical protein